MKKITIGFTLFIFLILPVLSLTEATVLRVIDGDTIVLTCGERVRLIGIDAPERGEAGANEATQFVREKVEGLTVWLEADGPDRDRIGRLRRYVWLQQPTNTQDENQIRQNQLNALLLENGLATVLILGNVRNAALFRQLASAQTMLTALPETQAGFIGNRNSNVFHTPYCNSLPAEHNRINFTSRDDAIHAGFRACQRCRP